MSAPNNNPKGILLILSGMALFSIQDSLIKYIFEESSLYELYFGRTLTALIAAAMSGLFISGLLYIAQKDKNPYRIKSLFNYIKTQFTSK